MKQLWAPWRMPYLEEWESEPGCLLCTKAREERDEQNHIVCRRPDSYVMLNLYPYNSGHLMVIPYQHTGQLQALQPDVGTDIFVTAQLCIEALGQVMHPDGFNLGINQGGVSGAGIEEHIHLHVVPRWAGDTNFMPVLTSAKVIPELLDKTAEKLRSAFQQVLEGT